MAPDFADAATSVIHISHIPPRSNDVRSLLRYFQKYGRIVAIRCVGDSATIAFDSVESAQRARDDPNSFLRNRFIQVRFHSSDASDADLMQYCDAARVSSIAHSANTEIADEVCEINRLRQCLLEERSKKNAERRAKQQTET